MAVPVRGSVFGFQIRSRLTFNYPRSGSAGSPLVVEEGPSAPPELPGELIAGLGHVDRKHPGFVDVYAVDTGYAIEADHAGWFHVQPRVPTVVIPKVEEKAWLEALVWGLPIALCLIERGDLVMHAAAVEIDGKAVVLAAPGGHGKSTLCLGFARRGFRILSDDLTCISATRAPMVWPGPGLIRIRRDVEDQVDTSRFTLVAEDHSKLHLQVPVLGTGAPIPLAVVVLLRPSAYGVRLDSLSPDKTISDLWRLGLNIPSDRGRASLLEKVVSLADSVEVWNLYRPLDVSNLDQTVDNLVGLCNGTRV